MNRDYIARIHLYADILILFKMKDSGLISLKLKQKKAGHINESGSKILNNTISIYQERPFVL